MALGWDDLAILSARFGVARFGASRFGFVPCPEDVKGAGFDEPGEYIYAEQVPPTQEVVTEWTLVGEDCVCRNLCTLEIRPTLNYWKLDEASGDRIDSTGDFDLGPINAPGSTTGQIDDAATFDDASLQLLTNESYIPLDGTYGITVAGWINVRTGNPATARYFWNGTSFVYVFLGTANAGSLWMFFSVQNAKGEASTAGVLLSAADTWYYVVGRYDPNTKKPSISIDGAAFVEGAALTQHPVIDSGSVFVGARSAGNNLSKSYIDELGVWNRLPSDAELTEFRSPMRPREVEPIVDEAMTIYVILAGVLGSPIGVLRINWGDGHLHQTNYDELANGVLSFDHTYDNVGDYTITMTLTDERGCSTTTTRDVTVVEPEEPAPEVYFTWIQLVEDTNITFTAEPGALDVLSIDWDFGEGGGTELDLGPTPSNEYPEAADTFTVVMTINATEGIFTDSFDVTTDFINGQSGSSQ